MIRSLAAAYVAFLLLLSGAGRLPGAQHGHGSGAPFLNRTASRDTIIDLPEPTGPHPVGTVTYHWVDRDRPESATADPHDLRQIATQIYFPARPAGDPRYAEYVPLLPLMRGALAADSRDVPRRIAADLARRAAVRTQSLRNGAIDQPRRAPRYPVVVVSPGGNMSRHWHTALSQELASHGYLVAVISHAYSGWDVFPAGGFIKSTDWGLDADDPAAARAAEDSLADLLAADARLTLDRLEELDGSDPHGRFTGRVDLTRVAVVGHSRGGSTVSRLCATSGRVDACVTFDNIGTEREAEEGLRKPQLVLRRPGWSGPRVERLRGFLSRNSVGATEVTVEGASHNSFTDLPIVDPENFASGVDPRRAHRITSDLTRAFLDRHLRSDSTRAVADAAARYPEADVRSFGPIGSR